MKSPQENSVLLSAFDAQKPIFKKVLWFSVFTNLMVLAPSWYMLEVYSRVISSRNHTTLIMLTLLVVGIYALMEVVDWVRSQILFKASLKIDESVREHLFNTAFTTRLRRQIPVGIQPFNDLKAIREALYSPGFLAIIDAPFALMFLLIIYIMHPSLGMLATVGAIVLLILAYYNNKRVHPPLKEASRHALAAQNYADGVIKNAQVIQSMGMLGDIHQRWMQKQQDYLRSQASASDGAAVNSALSKMIQTMQGSLILGFGCLLTLEGALDGAGAGMIVASILAGRVLSPLVQLIAQWRNLSAAQDAYERLDKMLSENPIPAPSMALPAPTGQLTIEGLVAGAPNSNVPILRNVSFRLPAGDVLAVVGPSACGKSTLARLMVGVWPALNGKVRLDGADIYAWDKSSLGQYVGYLPQEVELFDGTIAENISRFTPLATEADKAVSIEKVNTALQSVGMAQYVGNLPQGLDTPIGNNGAFLSGGQRQLIALARAIYGLPKLVVLDEPNASLDEAGDAALLNTIKILKASGATVVIITHRQQILSVVDKMLVLMEGQVKFFGPRDEVLAALKSPTLPAAKPVSPNTPAAAVN